MNNNNELLFIKSNSNDNALRMFGKWRSHICEYARACVCMRVCYKFNNMCIFLYNSGI